MPQPSSPQSTEITQPSQMSQSSQVSSSQLSQNTSPGPFRHIVLIEKRMDIVVIGMVVLETCLVLLALVPTQLWTRVLPNLASASLDGPFPPRIAPIITLLLYVVPTLIGLLSRSWQRALLLATLPAWLGLGAFLVAATFKIGAFYLVSADHVTANVSVLELFAALGAIGWLARHLLKLK